MVDYREADQDHQQTVLKKKCNISELWPEEELWVKELEHR